jgi:hypothetical protein
MIATFATHHTVGHRLLARPVEMQSSLQLSLLAEPHRQGRAGSDIGFIKGSRRVCRLVALCRRIY